MANKHRKLFPTLANANHSIPCQDFCDPPCSYNCYPYPDYNDILPPPALLSDVDRVDQSPHISPYVIVIVALLASFFLFVSYYVIIAKSCCGWCSSRSYTTTPSENRDEDFLDENQVDHPIWFVATVGLQPAIINSITVCRYKRGEGLVDGTDCSVCLNEFQEDDTLRLLPKCNHAFHIACIDTWLRSHTNCPLCRAHIVTAPASSRPTPVERSSENSSTIVNTQMEDSGNDRDFNENPERNGENYENRTETESRREIIPQVGDGKLLNEAMNSIENGRYQAVKKEIRPMRRSVSMNSSRASPLVIGVSSLFLVSSGEENINLLDDHEEDDREKVASTGSPLKQEGKYLSKFREKAGASSIAQRLHRGPVSMKRSFSCGGRFLSSRHHRSLNAIFPL